ncbi:H(+)-transporting two-sector ATPase E subunit [Methanocaldococcus sp. FS406-22]|uniref:V-type proton ATPase subunit E n=1 Tax=Methanocaldococcus sp. (strain FS406-22) TaxID=644281 RepID=UPI0001BF2F61|nr:V-type proton ATPase subunit E [Methanocaldococcus sp. FS406-22]ADC68703.1 H(+)-transporting two-sector ATPase E subunit [Methanocaldococcus sp. FS406-22]
MGVDKIKAKILEDAKAEANKIISEAEEEKAKILEKAKEEAEKRKAEILKKGEKEAEMTKSRIISEAKLEAKKKLLEAKEEIIEMAINKLKEELVKLPEQPEYKDKLVNLIKDGAVSLGGGELIVRLNSRDMELIEDSTLWNLEKEIESITKKVTVLKKGDPVDIIGGCIIETADGLKSLDNSLEAIFNRNLNVIRARITEKLF